MSPVQWYHLSPYCAPPFWFRLKLCLHYPSSLSALLPLSSQVHIYLPDGSCLTGHHRQLSDLNWAAYLCENRVRIDHYRPGRTNIDPVRLPTRSTDTKQAAEPVQWERTCFCRAMVNTEAGVCKQGRPWVRFHTSAYFGADFLLLLSCDAWHQRCWWHWLTERCCRCLYMISVVVCLSVMSLQTFCMWICRSWRFLVSVSSLTNQVCEGFGWPQVNSLCGEKKRIGFLS